MPPETQGGEITLDCVEDCDGDGNIGFSDLISLLSLWGTADPYADVDHDLVVGFSDLLIVLSNWGPCP